MSPLHWWLRSPEEQREGRRWATRELKARALADVAERLLRSQQREAARSALRKAERCGLCGGSGRVARATGRLPSGGIEYLSAACPCTQVSEV